MHRCHRVACLPRSPCMFSRYIFQTLPSWCKAAIEWMIGGGRKKTLTCVNGQLLFKHVTDGAPLFKSCNANMKSILVQFQGRNWTSQTKHAKVLLLRGLWGKKPHRSVFFSPFAPTLLLPKWKSQGTYCCLVSCYKESNIQSQYLNNFF